MEELRKIEKTSTKNLITNKLTVIDNLDIVKILEIASDTDKFLMFDNGTIKYVTGANLLSYIGGSSTAGTVTSVGGTGTINGLTLTGTVTSSGNLTLGGTLAINNGDWSGTDLAVANGGTGASDSNAWLNSRITTNANGSLNYDATGATAVNHNSLTGYDADEHINWTNVSAGTIHTSNYVDNDTTYSVMASGNSYAAGLVAAGSGTHGSEFLRKDGTWVVPTNTTYSVGDGGLTTNDFTNDDHTKLNGISASADVTDATTVAAAGALMDSEVTNLSQVKAFDSSDYATAAQGSKADSAQQPPTEGAFANGDKTKLDGIAAGAQVNVSGNSGNAAVYDNSGDAALKTGITGAEVRAAIGAGTSNLALGTSGSTALAGNTALLQIGTSGSTAMAGNTAVGDSNVKSNWNESDTNDDSFIQNKPNVQYTSAISTGNNGLVPSAGTSGHFLKHNGTFGQIQYSNINSAPQEFDNDNNGLVPSPGSSGTTTRFLREDGTFQVPAYVADTTYTGGTNLTLAGTTFNVDDAFLKNDADDVMDGALTVNSHILAKTVVYFDAETATTIGNGATGVIDWTVNQKQKVTITGTSITCNFTNPPGPCNLILKVVQGDGSDVIGTWDGDIKWPTNGTAPTLSTGNGDIDILSFYWDGTNYFGVASLDFA